MSKKTSTDPEEEKEVKDIIDALKSEGLFDQFRKECLADVDTKPAYQNLRQRVEGYVSRFLSRQQWSPSLNKNQLRDNLRKQITASGMLANGVERVIEQVINPKILQLIKPKIDDVVCTHLGIDPKERQAKQEAKKQEQKQNLQSLMSINLSQAETSQTSTPSSSFQGQESGPSFSSPYSQALWTQQMPPQVAFGGMMPNFPMVPPFGGFPFGMPPQMFPYWNNFMYPQPMPGMPGIPFPPPMSSTADTTTVSSAQFGISPIPPVPTTPTTMVQTTATDTPTPPKSSQPPLPPTPPPPGTEDIPVDLPKEEKKDSVTKALFSESKTEDKEEIEIPKILDDIPLPPVTTTTNQMKTHAGNFINVITDEDTNSSFPMQDDDDYDENRDSKRTYKFAWDEDVDKKSDITISSVHTSDLSSFEDFEGESDENLFESDKSDVEEDLDDKLVGPQGSPLSAVGDSEEEISENLKEIETTEVNVPTEVVTSTEAEEETPENQTQDVQNVSDISVQNVNVPDVPVQNVPLPDIPVQNVPLPDIPMQNVPLPDVPIQNVSLPDVPIQTVPLSDVPIQTVPLPDVPIQNVPLPNVPIHNVPLPEQKELSPSKPRKLLSLQYNYSDDEDEETREDRKNRIAKEKEERYVKRAQRRAELEAKRKEREEEKARIREERKKSQDLKSDESSDKVQTDSSEKIDRTDSIEELSPEKVPTSPDKKKRKTKAELKMELKEQKVMEKKLALRRQRTRNRRYTSDEFTSIFTEKKQPFSSQSYTEVVIEEPTIEETVVTDNIEYIHVVDDSQSQPPAYQTQEVCETMEGEVILEDGRQLKVEVFMEDMIPSPPTPTQDEVYSDIQTIDTANTQIEESSVSSAQEQSINSSEDTRRPQSPLSDVSDESLTEIPKGSKRKRQSSESAKSDKEPKKSQRYETSDLYKPRPTISGSRRRSSPGAAVERRSSPGSAMETTKPEQKKHKTSQASRSSSRVSERSRSSRSRSRSVESDCQPSPISSSSLASVHSGRSSYSRSRSRSNSSSSSEEKSRSRSRSSSGSSVDEFGRRKRRKGKMPIDMIDFGEAERMIEKKLYRVSFGEAERRAASRRIKGRGRGMMTRGSWQRQNSWQFPDGASSASWSPPGSPSKRFYFPDPGRSPSPPSPMREMSPGIVRRPRTSPSPPPMWDARSESPPYYPGTRGRRSSSQIEDSPPRRPMYAMGRRPQSPPPEYLRRSLSPSEHIMSRGQISPPPWGRDSSMSPPYLPGRMTPSPPPYIPRGQRSPSPPGRAYLRGRSPSPPYRPGVRGQRSPSPTLSRGGHSQSPPFYRGSPPHRPVTRGRSPSPQYLRRTPSPPHRPVTRGQRSPSPPMHRRPISPPSRPQTRGQNVVSPHDLRKKPGLSPKVPMTNKLRNIKFGSPFQQQTGTRRQRPSSPTERVPNKRGRR